MDYLTCALVIAIAAASSDGVADDLGQKYKDNYTTCVGVVVAGAMKSVAGLYLAGKVPDVRNVAFLIRVKKMAHDECRSRPDYSLEQEKSVESDVDRLWVEYVRNLDLAKSKAGE